MSVSMLSRCGWSPFAVPREWEVPLSCLSLLVGVWSLSTELLDLSVAVKLTTATCLSFLPKSFQEGCVGSRSGLPCSFFSSHFDQKHDKNTI